MKQAKMGYVPFCYLFLLAVNTVNAQTTEAPEQYDCDNIIANSTKQAIEELNYCTYPTHKINESCVAESCPELKSTESLCSSNNDESANLENVNKTLSIINECLKQAEICGFSINPDRLPTLIFNANQLIPIPGVSSYCTSKTNTSSLNNINHTDVTASIPDSPITNGLNISVQVQNLSYDGTLFCTAQEHSIKYPIDIPFKVKLDISASTFLPLNNITGNPIQITHVKVIPKVIGLISNPLSSVTPLSPLVISTSTDIIKNSSLPEKYARFIVKIVISAFKAANKQCTETE